MRMKKITKRIGKLVVLLCVVLCMAGMLSGCGAPTEDPVAEDYLVKLLDAINKNDADAAYSLCWDEQIAHDDVKTIINAMHENWDGGEYTYKFLSSQVTKTVATNGTFKMTTCNYEVVTKEKTCVFEVSYIKDKGVVGFYMHM